MNPTVVKELEATVLVDNDGCSGLTGEWGLAFHIVYRGHRILLDAGSSGLFASNAALLGIDLSAVDCAVLSHAHYDHSLGLETFFGLNAAAPLYVSRHTAEDCYHRELFSKRYIGVPVGMLDRFSSRIVRTGDAPSELFDGVWVVPHRSPCCSCTARRSHLYRRIDGHFVPDDFMHEQSLVFETESGPVVFSSCSHSGLKTVVADVEGLFPGISPAAFAGGLHLFRSGRRAVRETADIIRANAGMMVYAGHCTGDTALRVLTVGFPDRVVRLQTGTRILF